MKHIIIINGARHTIEWTPEQQKEVIQNLPSNDALVFLNNTRKRTEKKEIFIAKNRRDKKQFKRMVKEYHGLCEEDRIYCHLYDETRRLEVTSNHTETYDLSGYVKALLHG
jgi:hypothetical protein